MRALFANLAQSISEGRLGQSEMTMGLSIYILVLGTKETITMMRAGDVSGIEFPSPPQTPSFFSECGGYVTHTHAYMSSSCRPIFCIKKSCFFLDLEGGKHDFNWRGKWNKQVFVLGWVMIWFCSFHLPHFFASLQLQLSDTKPGLKICENGGRVLRNTGRHSWLWFLLRPRSVLSFRRGMSWKNKKKREDEKKCHRVLSC